MLTQLLTDAAVDAFAEQVGVPVVAGVLVDHVDQDAPHRLPTALAECVTVCDLGYDAVGEGDLLPPRPPRLFHNRRIAYHAGKVRVSLVAIGLVAAGDLLPEPVTLDIGEVTKESQ